jgi:hypothetical protein
MARKSRKSAPLPTGPDPKDPYDIQFFRRHKDDDPDETVPARAAMAHWPDEVMARVRAVIIEVAKAPPTRFAGGTMWIAMHDDMSGFYEVRTRHRSRLYRVFCILDPAPSMDARTGERHPQNVLAIIAAGWKKNATAFSVAFYRNVRELGDEYRAREPRSWDQV